MINKLAVVGATGNVGREIISILEERNFPTKNLILLASENSKGSSISFKKKELIVQSLKDYDFKGTDIALFSPGGKVSAEFAPKAAREGCIVIDNTSYFRMDKDIPLVIPEVNPEDIIDYRNKNIISNPNCSTIQMLVALKPLHELATIKRIVVSTYQSVSGAGKSSMDELFESTRKIYLSQDIEQKNFTKQIAFNAIPHIDVFMKDMSTKEEWKMIMETKKILDKNIEVSATCVRVPVFNSHGESINVEFKNKISIEDAKHALKKADSIILDEDDKYTTQIEASSRDEVFVSRLRRDSSVDNGINLWVVSDNLRKGAALNAIQIAEILTRDYLKS